MLTGSHIRMLDWLFTGFFQYVQSQSAVNILNLNIKLIIMVTCVNLVKIYIKLYSKKRVIVV